jgi:PiT family inorganic phosphate transporter
VLFNILAGFNDGGNLLAAAASGRIVGVRAAFVIIIAFVFVGPLIFGTAVASTIGTGIVNYAAIGAKPLLAGLAGALATVLLSYAARIPTSLSLALVSAMIGALLSGPGLANVHWSGLRTVGLSMVLSIVGGFAAGAALYAVLRFALRPVTLQTGERLMRLQFLTVALQALGYGANDAEKMMGLMAVAASLGTAAASGPLVVPLWAVALSVAAFAVGLIWGGVRIARAVGGKLFQIRPLHAMAFQSAAGTTVMIASFLGGPLSTTETTASAIIGAGAAANSRMLHWQAAAHIILAWVLTVPAGVLLGYAAGLVLQRIF